MVVSRNPSEPTPFVLPDTVIGAIGLWSGTVGTIPSGWSLCDGTNGTPDLTDKFVVGAGDTYPVAGTGGNEFHNHPFTGDNHRHTLKSGVDIGAGPDFQAQTELDPAVGTTDNSDVPLTYYSLANIMYTGD